MANEDTQLIRRAHAGDRGALEALLREEEIELREWLGRRIGAGLSERLDVEDALQETLAQAVASFGKFEHRGAGALRAWLHSIGEHVILRAADARRRKPVISLRHEVAADDASPSRTARREERFERLEGALARLPGEYREVIRLARLEGLPIAEIAVRMQRSAAAVSMLLSRALRRLREGFGDTESMSLPDRMLGRGPSREGDNYEERCDE